MESISTRIIEWDPFLGGDSNKQEMYGNVWYILRDFLGKKTWC